MAQQSIQTLFTEAISIINKDTKYLRKYYNRKPHIFTVNKESLKIEVLFQVGRKKLTERQAAFLDKSLDKYSKSLYTIFKTNKEKTFSYEVYGSDYTDFRVVIEGLDPDSNVFAKVRSLRKPHLQVLKNELLRDVFNRGNKEELKTAILGTFDPEINNTRGGLFDLGRGIENSTSQLLIKEAASVFSGIDLQSVDLELAIKARESGTKKKFEISISDQSSKRTRGRGQLQKEFLNDTRKLLRRIVRSNPDWADQKGGRSMNDMIVDNLIGVAKPYAKKITKTNLGSGTSSTAIQGIVKGTTSKPKKVPHSIIVDKVQAGGSQFSLSSLLALMNNKLSETVAQKMGLPRLVYRTGRFANSVRVVNIQETKQGFPVISYTYQRNPYDVFDPVLGASPWNTPSRDPKEIITISVREVAKELALGRFFVKRAG